jgi:hypothetical protein
MEGQRKPQKATDRRPVSRGSEPGPPELEAGALNTTLRPTDRFLSPSNTLRLPVLPRAFNVHLFVKV